MNARLFSILHAARLPDLMRATAQRRKVTILVFHHLSPDLADRAFAFLSRAYNVVPLARAAEAIGRNDPAALPERPLVITFDDGLKSHYDLLPAIRKHGLPVTIFICAGLVGTNRHFWFLHDSPCRSDRRWPRLTHTARLERLKEEGFRFEEEYEPRQALSREEIEEMRPFVDFQCHSMFHENIETCSPEDLRTAVVESKKKLEDDFGLTIRAFAFPAGDYAPEHVALAREAGYACAVTVDPGFNPTGSDLFRLKRIEALGPGPGGTLNELVVRSSGLLVLPKAFIRTIRKTLSRLRRH